jgi:pimeloyl-ACP methyl ester carboxylesterase
MPAKRLHERIFTVSITGISRGLMARDRLVGWFGPGCGANPEGVATSEHAIVSGRNLLHAVFARPAMGEARTALVICHGIGEAVERWLGVQRLLAANGVASLVFNYSGYGRSTGRVDAEQCVADAVAAFGYLEGLMPGMPVSLLGFSMGSGVAAAAVKRVNAHRLVLGAGFPSFEAAAKSAGVPGGIARYFGPLWRAEESLCGCRCPVLVVHGERDGLFPVKLAEELAACCGAELRVVPGVGHNEPFRRPRAEYWKPIVEWLEAGLEPEGSAGAPAIHLD